MPTIGNGDKTFSRIRKSARASSFYRCFHINEKLYFHVAEQFFMLWTK